MTFVNPKNRAAPPSSLQGLPKTLGDAGHLCRRRAGHPRDQLRCKPSSRLIGSGTIDPRGTHGVGRSLSDRLSDGCCDLSTVAGHPAVGLIPHWNGFDSFSPNSVSSPR